MNQVTKDIKKLYDLYLKENYDKVQNHKYRQKFHIEPPVGWLNDPNGTMEYEGKYYIYYQYAPFSADGESIKHWGLYTTKDFIEYEDLGIAMYADENFDVHGAYSGSSFIK